MRSRKPLRLGKFDFSAPRDEAASIGKLIITSAAVNARPVNHVREASSLSMKTSWRFKSGLMNPSSTLSAMALAIGLAKKGIDAFLILLKTSAITSGGIAEPSAKCSQ